jgi:hypothetical protein
MSVCVLYLKSKIPAGAEACRYRGVTVASPASDKKRKLFAMP